MTKGSSIQLLDHWLLAGVPRAELQPLLTGAQQVRFLPGEVIFQEGDDPDGLYLLADGSVRVSAMNEQREVLLAEIGSNDVLGEMGILDGESRSGTATSRGMCTAYFVPVDAFLDTLERSPKVCMRLLALLTERLRLSNEPLKRFPRAAAADDPYLAQVLGVEPTDAKAAAPQAETSRIFRTPSQAPPRDFLAPQTESFYDWLTRHVHWEQNIGDLARHASVDNSWPKDADDIETVRRHLDRMSLAPSMQNALTAAWKNWQLTARRADPGAMLH